MDLMSLEHNFGKEIETSINQLYQFFCNNVNLGQWQLAKACLKQLVEEKMLLGVDIDSLIKSIIQKPDLYCVWNEINSQNDQLEDKVLLKYIIYSHFESLVRNKDPSSFKSHIETIENELDTENKDNKTFELMTHQFIKNVLLNDPIKAKDLLVLLLKHFPFYEQNILKVHLEALYETLENFEMSVSHRKNTLNPSETFKKNNLFLLINLLMVYKQCENDLKTIESMALIQRFFKELCTKLNSLFQDDLQELESNFINVFSSLNNYLLESFTKISYEIDRQLKILTTFNDENLVIFSNIKYYLNVQNKEKYLWKYFFMFTYFEKRCLIKTVIDECLVLIGKSQFENLAIIFTIKEFVNLKPIILLMGISKVKDLQSAKKLINSICLNNDKGTLIEKITNLLKTHLDFINWFQQVEGHRDEICFNKLLKLLHKQLPINVISQYLDITKIDYTEMNKMLRNTLVDKDNSKKTKLVRFVDEVNEKISFIQESCLAIFDGFYCINQIVNSALFCCENLNESLYKQDTINTETRFKKLRRIMSIETDDTDNHDVSSFDKIRSQYNDNVILVLDKVKKILNEMQPLNYRLEILENIYSLIFISSNDLKKSSYEDENSDESQEVYNPVERNNLDDFEIVENVDVYHKTKDIDGSIYETTTYLNEALNSSSKSALETSSKQDFKKMTRNAGGGDLFLMNDFMCRDILLLLKELLQVFNSIDQKSFILDQSKTQLVNSSISTLQDMVTRSKKLYQLVNETLWRFQLIKIDSIQIEYGQINMINSFNKSYHAKSYREQNLVYQLMKRRKRRDSNVSNESSKHDFSLSLTRSKTSETKTMISYTSREKRKSLESQRSLSLIYPQIKNKNTNSTCMKLLADFETLSVICLKNSKTSEANQLVKLYSSKSNSFEFSQIVFNGVYKKFLDDLFKLNSNKPDSILEQSLQSLNISKLIESIMTLSDDLITQCLFLSDILVISKIDRELINHLLEYSYVKLNQVPRDSESVIKIHSFIDSLKVLVTAKLSSDKFLIEYLTTFDGLSTRTNISTSIDKNNKMNQLLSELNMNLTETEIDKTYQSILNSLKKCLNENEDFITSFIYGKKSDDLTVSYTDSNNYLLSFYEYTKKLTEYLKEKSSETTSRTSNFSILEYTPASLICKLLFEDFLKPESIETLTQNLNLNLTAIILHNSCPRLKLISNKQNFKKDKNLVKINSDVTVYNIGYFYSILNENDVISCSRRKPHEFVKQLLFEILKYSRGFLRSNVKGLDVKKALELYHSAEFKKILNQSQELQHLNLDYLQNDTQKLSFFINLHNLLSIHSHLHLASVNHSKSIDEFNSRLFKNNTDKILFEQKMCYKIGQMGYVSLYDLKNLILLRRYNVITEPEMNDLSFSSSPVTKTRKSIFNRISGKANTPRVSETQHHIPETKQDLSKHPLYELDLDAEPIWSKYLPNESLCDYKVIFALIDCTQSDPPICVFDSDELLYDQLNMQMKLFLNRSVFANTKKEVLYVPGILVDNLAYFQDSGMSSKFSSFLPGKTENTQVKNELENLTKFLIEHVSLELKESLKQLLNLDQGYGENIDLYGRKELPFPIVKLEASEEYSLGIETESNWYKTQMELLDKKTDPHEQQVMTKKLLNQECLEYIRKNSPLISNNLYFLFDSETQEEFFKILNDLKIQNLIEYDTDNQVNNYLNRFFQLYVPLDHMSHLDMSNKLDMVTQFLLNNRTEQSKIELIIDLANYYCTKQDWQTVINLLDDCTQDNEELNDLTESTHFISDSKFIQKDLYNLYDYACVCLASQESKFNDKSYVHLFKMKNFQRQVRAIFGLIDLWSIHGCLELIDYCLTKSKAYDFDPILTNILTNKKTEFIAYKDLTVCAQTALEKYYEHQQIQDAAGFYDSNNPTGFSTTNEIDFNFNMQHMNKMKRICQRCLTWQYAKAQLETSKTEDDETKELIMDLFLLNDQFTSAKYLVKKLNLGNKLEFKLDFGHLKYRLLNLNASSSIIEIDLDAIVNECISFKDTNMFDICFRLLNELKDFNELNNQVLISLSEFLIKNYTNMLNETQLNEFKILQLTARIFQILVQDESIYFDSYKRHHSQPILIIEQLLMNNHIDLCAKTIKMCRESLNDSRFNSEINNILVKYAHKALQFRIYKQVESETERSSPSKIKSIKTSIISVASSPSTNSILSNFKSKTNLFQTESSPRSNFIMPSLPPNKEDWIKDEDVDDCMVCTISKFSLLNRRHHCRRCGRVVCSNCSQRTTLIDNVLKRTCDDCIKQLETSTKSIESKTLEKDEVKLIIKKRHTEDFDQVINYYLIGNNQNESSRSRDQEVRDNFRFQQAPSTSLCLSILDLHDNPLECGKDLLNMCDDLSVYLQNAGQLEDHSLVINMIKHLLHNAKVKLLQNSSSNIISLVDTYLSLIDILEQLLLANCSIIPSLNELRNSESIRRIRNRLLEEERHELAMNLSTKCGLDTQTVWASWGLIELRRSNYKEARAKFEKCLKQVSDKNCSIGPSNLKILNDILNFFENTPPVRILTTQSFLAQLKNVESLVAEPKLYSVGESHMDDIQFKESMFYLDTYGTHSLIVSFFQRNGFLESAFKYLIDKKCSTDIFVDVLLATSLRTGEFFRLLEIMFNMEKHQNKLQPYYAAIGKYLEKCGYLNTLYDFQMQTKDYVRACMSCIYFFQRQAESYQDLFNNLFYLNKARKHLEQYLELSANKTINISNSQQQQQTGVVWKQKSEQTLCKQMSAQEIDSYINAINLQIEVTKFLHGCKKELEVKTKKPSTLFGSNDAKINLCCQILLTGETVQEGFGFVIRIIQCFNLNSTLVYSQISRELAKQFNFKEINNLLKCIDESGYKEDINVSFDECISTCIRVFAASSSDQSSDVSSNQQQQVKYNKEIENLIQLIKNDENKINAYILNGRLKSAYLIAIKIERADIVKHIANVAERMGQNLIKDICTKWLEKNVK